MHQEPELLEAYRRGETWAFTIIYERYVDSVTHFLRGGFNFQSEGRNFRFQGRISQVDYDGIVQETFARVFQESTRVNYDGQRSIRNYMFSIAKNLVLRELKKNLRTTSIEDLKGVQEAWNSEKSMSVYKEKQASPESLVQESELQDVIKHFISELDDEERNFFRYRFTDGLAQMATAEKMEVTRARVKLIEKRLRKRFLIAFRKEGYFVGYTPKPRWLRSMDMAS